MLEQKLQVKLKNTPTDIPLVCSSVSSGLNKEEISSVQNKVLACNDPEVDLLQHTGDQNLRVSDNVYVFVLNKRKLPLMPTSCRKARLLLKQGRAVIIKRFPFTIQLLYSTGENKQETRLGIDSGGKVIGCSVISPEKELIATELELDNLEVKHLTERKMYRKLRRNRLWYREPRFMNRKKKEGWLPPSIERKYQTHLSLIKNIKTLVPISKVKIEVGNFDIQKLINPEISGKEYQQGNLYEYNNVKEFILVREKRTCQLCGKTDQKNNLWRLHHIDTIGNTGTDRPDNLALLHEKCHEKLHKQHLEKKLKKNKQYKEATFMNIIKNRFQKDLDCEITFGYETKTKTKRNELKLEKSHINDAFVIAGGTVQTRNIKYLIKQRRRNNRSLQLNRKGFKPSIRRQRYNLQPGDLVKIEKDKNIYEVVGTHNLGKNIIIKYKGNKNKSISVKKVVWKFNNKSLIWKNKK